MSKLRNIDVVVRTKHGVVQGKLNSQAVSLEDAETIRDQIQATLNSLQSITVFGKNGHNQDTQTTFAAPIIQDSLFEFKITVAKP